MIKKNDLSILKGIEPLFYFIVCFILLCIKSVITKKKLIKISTIAHINN